MAAPGVARIHPAYQVPPADRASARALKRRLVGRLKTLDSYYARAADASFAPTEEAAEEVAML